jgi:glycosyltransferase involved in cell wall biosynthesis
MSGWVDEFVIGIDTECKDSTKDKVLGFFYNDGDVTKGLKDEHKDVNVDVYDYKWKDSFSDARNEGMDRATGDFILIMDGHEYFPKLWYNISQSMDIPIKEIMPKIKKAIFEEQPHEGYFQLYQQPFRGVIPHNFFQQPRVYRNHPKIRFNRHAHNVITNTDHSKAIHYNEVIIIHDAPEANRIERSLQRVKMNTKVFKEAIKNKKDDKRSLFYLGNTLLEAKKFKPAIKAFDDYLKAIGDFNHSEKYQVLVHKALGHIALKQYEAAKLSLGRAVVCDSLRRDAYVILGDLYCEMGEYERGSFEYNHAISLKPQPSRMFQNGANLTFDPYRKLAMAYEKLGDKPRAVYYWKEVYKMIPDESILKKISKLNNDKQNVLIIDAIGSFTKDIKKHYDDRGCSVVLARSYTKSLGAWADIIWQEWADVNATHSTNQHPEKTILRVHGYEWYLNKRILKEINWRCKAVIFVAKHIKDKVEKYCEIKDTLLIHNGVDVDSFYIKNYNRDPKQIGYAGFINEKKNPGLLLRIIKANPDYTFNLRIDWQSPFWEETFKYELKDCKNVIYHGRYEDLSEFWNKMGGVLSTSITESFSFNIAEAMSCGCKPYIYKWEGSDNIWPKEFIFDDMPTLDAEPSSKETMRSYSDFVRNTYSLQRMLNAINSVVDLPNKDTTEDGVK